MSEKQKDKLNLEQQIVKVPVTNANEITGMVENGRYDAAYSTMKSPEAKRMDDEGWTKVEGAADDTIKGISKEKLPEGPLSESDAENGVKSAEDAHLNEFGNEQNPEFNSTYKAYQETLKTDLLLDDLKKAIIEAKEQATKSNIAKPAGIVAPVIGSIWGIFKGKRLKERLSRIEGLYSQLQNQPHIDSRLQHDKISPNKGHWSGLTAGSLSIAGYVMPPLWIGAGVAGIISVFRSIKGYDETKQTEEALDNLDSQVKLASKQNSDLKHKLEVHMESYRTGARENIAGMTSFS